MADDLTVTREGDTLVIRIPIKPPAPSPFTAIIQVDGRLDPDVGIPAGV